MDIMRVLIFGVVVLLTHFLEGITGFGCTVLAMPFAILLVGIHVAKPTLTLYGFLLCVYVVIISYKDILWKNYLRILTFVGLGLPVGIYFFNKLPESLLRKILAIFMITISIRGLYLCYNKHRNTHPMNERILNFILFLGGCIHGAFTSGGPLVIIYASEKLKDKSTFRATLCLLWVTLNSVLLIQSFTNGSFTPEAAKLALYCLPFLVIGAILGNIFHHKIHNDIFLKIVYLVLILSACFMFL